MFFTLLVAETGFSADVVPNEVQQPGTQPLEINNLESPNKCDNCHGGYDNSVEPAHNWRGSMMANAGRDPIFWATLAIAERDFDGAGDLCLRCHSTGGWLAGRSIPTDGSGLSAGDSDGVECDYCHKLTNSDDTEHLGIMNAPFIANDGSSPAEGFYGSGMSSMWGGGDKLGPYVDADARHQFMKSLFHRTSEFCGTCHDVSNPVTGDLAHNFGALASQQAVSADGLLDSATDTVGDEAAFNNPPYRYGIVERTFSEHMSSAIATMKVDDYPAELAEFQGGAFQAIYDATFNQDRGTADYEDGTPRFYSCQTCHMSAVTGAGANKSGVPIRSDLPLHDMTGGNYWMADAIKYLDNLGKLRLGGGMTAAQRQALDDGKLRAQEQLRLAATLEVEDNELEIVNHTGHKLPTGYPEGRRMWLKVKWYGTPGTDNLLREDGAYGALQNVTALGQPVRSILDLEDPNLVIYETHMGMTQEWASQLLHDFNYPADLALSYDRDSGEVDLTLGSLAGQVAGTTAETFHFVLNNAVVKDNRIPPYRMNVDEAARRNVFVDASEYPPENGFYPNHHEVELSPPPGAVWASINLLYQPTSWEYLQFLDLANENNPNAFLAAEGANMLEAWVNTEMAAPFLMASAIWTNSEEPSMPPATPRTPNATDGAYADRVRVIWSDVSGEDYYQVYRCTSTSTSSCGSAISEPEANDTSDDDFGATPGVTYYYRVKACSTAGGCSGFSNYDTGYRQAAFETAARSLIGSFYLDILGRGPEPGAIDSWYDGYFQYAELFNIDVRFVPREMARIFFLSAEYVARDRSDEEFIRDCYQVFLSRQPSAEELAAWLSGIWERAPTLAMFSESQEFGERIQLLFPGMSGNPTRNFVTTMYIGFLDRLVDSGGLEHYAGLFDTAYATDGLAGVRDESVEFGRTVLASAEYLSQSPTNETHVNRFYRAYLGRYPTENELGYWVSKLDSGTETTDRVMNLFANSDEFTTKLNTYFGSP